MKWVLAASLALVACSRNQPAEQYGFITRLGRDTIAAERIVRTGSTLTSDETDRFPRVRQRHTVIDLNANGSIKRLAMDITTPSAPEKERVRHVVADVSADSVIIVKRDGTGALRWAFATGGNIAMAHVPQMYSLYELFFAAALRRMASSANVPGDTTRLRQFYIDREFDRFPLHGGTVRRPPGGKAEIWHDWLAGVGEATLDSNFRLVHYSGARTTYDVDVTRVSELPDVDAIGKQLAAHEASIGVKQLSVRDTARGRIGDASFIVDYGRPLVRGRTLLGALIPYGVVWRTGANAATQFTTSAPILLGGLRVPAGTYTLWTVFHEGGAELIVNRQTGQWGTSYDASRDLGRVPMRTDTLAVPVEQFTISIMPTDARRGTLVLEWGPKRWITTIAADVGRLR